MSSFLGSGSSALDSLEAVIKGGAFLVDVRTPMEYEGGSVPGAVNIPLDRVTLRLDEFKNQDHIVVFCRSGNRSAQAKAILEINGFSNVLNGGAWENVKRFVK